MTYFENLEFDLDLEFEIDLEFEDFQLPDFDWSGFDFDFDQPSV